MRWGWRRRVASPERWIKQGSGLVTTCLVGLVVFALPLRAQAPDDDWRTLTTEHFRVTFPARMEPLGRRAASLAEVAYGQLSSELVDPPTGMIDLVVTDHSDESNGYAQIVPSNRIVVFARPPVDGPSLSYFDDWMELVITHELAHTLHLDHGRNPIGRLLRAVFGRAESGWPYFPGVATPGWTIEGLATRYESDLTSAGRAHGTFHEAVLRTAVLEGRFEGIGQAGGESPLWPGGNRAYVYGSMFFEHLLERYGEERMTAFVDAVAGQWIPYRLDSAGRTAFGVSLSQAWSEWGEELRARYALFDAELARTGPVTSPERLTDGARWAFHPSVSPDGSTLVYARADGRSDIQLRRQPVDGDESDSESISRTNGLATYAWMPDGRLLVAQLENDGPYRLYSDLYLMDLSGATERVTRGARLEQPSVAPDGTWAVAVQNGEGTNGLVRVALGDGAVSMVVAPHADVHWAFPRISPDGRWIAATRWDAGAYQDIVVLDAHSGREVHRVTRDRALDHAPAWSPDGRWLVWSSDRSGIMNILVADVDGATGRLGSPRRLTNVRTAAVYPSVGTDGRLYFSVHHVDGWEAERIAFVPESAAAAAAPVSRFAPPPTDALTPPPAVDGEVRSYSIWPTLLPTYWLPRLSEPVEVGVLPGVRRKEVLGWRIGAETSGVDLVGRHAYSVYAQAITPRGEIEGGASYAYRGFGNPVLSLAAEQRWSSGGAFLTGALPDTLYLLDRDRTVNGSIGVVSAAWRRRLSLTVGGGLIWRERRALDAALDDRVTLADPNLRLAEGWVAVGYSTARSFSFQTGGARGLSASMQARSRRELGLAGDEEGVVGEDLTFADLTGRVRGYQPLWGGGHATHVLAAQVAAGSAWGPGAQRGHFGVGGASGAPEDLTGFELFGGSYVFLPVRGYPTYSRFGRFAWAASLEYRFPIALFNRGLGPWPLHFDRVVGAAFVDAGDAWSPYPRIGAIASGGAEITVGFLAWYNTTVLLRTGVAVPWAGGADPQVYVRMGLPF
jgi:Tol biopolymer transport system component